jgi:hypothetical protein
MCTFQRPSLHRAEPNADQCFASPFSLLLLPNSRVQPQTMPKCRYEVLSGDTGHPISFAAIGQPIQHKWSCTGGGGGGAGASKEESGAGLYCLTVHSGFIDCITYLLFGFIKHFIVRIKLFQQIWIFIKIIIMNSRLRS